MEIIKVLLLCSSMFTSMTIYDFTKGVDNIDWVQMDDPVMGGRSESRFRLTNIALYFEGNLSLENNGGFAFSVFKNPKRDLSGYKEWVLKVKGDSRPYGLSIMSGSTIYRSYFSTNGNEQIVRIPFTSLKPTRYGEVIAGPAFDPRKSDQIGFVIADKKAGRFQLVISSISVE